MEVLLLKKIEYGTSFRKEYPDCIERMLPEDNDGVDDSITGKNSNNMYIWTCGRGHKFRASPHAVGHGCTCTLCKKKIRKSLREKSSDIADELRPEDNGGLTADDVGSGSPDKYI